jgi:mRNA interferase RelE/StbE
MAVYDVKILGAAQRQLGKLPKQVQIRILDKIEKLSIEPRPKGYRQLKAEENLFRVRVGDYRIIYQIQDKVLVILILRIAHRKDVYR